MVCMYFTARMKEGDSRAIRLKTARSPFGKESRKERESYSWKDK